MDVIEFSGDGGRVRVSWSFDGDYYVAIDAKAFGFRGHADGHVVADGFRELASGIVALADSRRGKARFQSAAPDLFDMTVRSTDSTGHLCVFGSLSATSGANQDQKLNFLLHFEPSQIESAARALRGVSG